MSISGEKSHIEKLSREDIRLWLPRATQGILPQAHRPFHQIDYARAMAFVALDKEQQELLGVARLAADPDYIRGEYAIIVRSDLKGIGWALMRHLIAMPRRKACASSLATC